MVCIDKFQPVHLGTSGYCKLFFSLAWSLVSEMFFSVISHLCPREKGGGMRGRNGGKNLLNTDLLSPVQNAQIPFHLDP